MNAPADIAPRRIITPAPFEPAPPAPASSGNGAGALPLRALAVLLALALLAVGLLVLLPRWTPPRAISTPAPAGSPDTALAPVATEPALDDEQRTDIARRTAQILLRATLARLAQLEALQVESWDRGALHHLKEQLAAGEKAYSEQRFRAAQDAYRDALVRAAQVELKLPTVIAALLRDGEAALRAGNSAAADAAYAQVLGIAPGQSEAIRGRARAATLDRVRALVEQAEAYEQRGDEDKARVVYKDAARLDPDMTSVQAGLARLDAVARTRHLGAALSAGHVALEHGDFSAARAAFKRAAALDADHPEVVAGLRETERRATAADISAALGRAALASTREAWSEAAQAYALALSRDADLGAAADGKREAEQRAQLDAQLEHLRDDVLALADGPRREIATATLKRAQALPAPGPRLRGQIAALSRALRVAREPLAVTLLSDGQSEVSIDGAGALGRFNERQVTLAPGRHSALIQREGKAAVRIEFLLTPGADPPRVSLTAAP